MRRRFDIVILPREASHSMPALMDCGMGLSAGLAAIGRSLTESRDVGLSHADWFCGWSRALLNLDVPPSARFDDL